MSHTAELIAVGTELLLGNIANTDAQMLSQGLSALGINVYYHTVVGDNPQRLRAAVELARTRADIIITTGGLGPTCDDLTKNVLAECFGKPLVFHEPSARRIEAYFQRLHAGRPMTENNYQQAMLPEGCTVLDNDWGTAPGVAFEAGGVRVIMLPGPPRECKAMFTHRVVPYLKSLADGVIVSRTLKLFGIGESSMEAQLRDEMNAMTNPTLAPYAKEGECELRITARADTQGGYSNRNTRNAPAAGRSNSSGSAAASAPPPEAPSTTASVDTTASLAASPASSAPQARPSKPRGAKSPASRRPSRPRMESAAPAAGVRPGVKKFMAHTATLMAKITVPARFKKSQARSFSRRSTGRSVGSR